MLIVYITCENIAQAEKLGKHLLVKKLCGCVNILPHMEALFFWPEGKSSIEKNSEVVLLGKTFAEKFEQIVIEVKKLHSYKIPCIIGIPITHIAHDYEQWLKKEME